MNHAIANPGGGQTPRLENLPDSARYVTSNLLSLIVYVNIAARLVVRNGAGISMTRYRVLSVLERNGGKAHAGEISRWLQLSAPTVAEAAGDLRAHGMIDRTRDEQDRRRVVFSITGKGTQAVRSADHVLASFVHDLWRPLSEEHRNTIVEGAVEIDKRFKGELPRDKARLIGVYLEVFWITYDVFSAAVHRHKLTVNTFRVLFELSERSEGMAMKDLARSLLLRPSELTPLIDSLEADGSVRRGDDPKSMRTVIVSLTERGAARCSQALPDVEECFCQGTYDTPEAHRSIYSDEADLILRELRRAVC